MENSSKTPKEIMSHWHLGQTSSKYEAGNRGISTISTGRGDHGGVSYGAYQLSSKMGTLQKFLRHSKYEEYFSDKDVEIIYFPYTQGTSSTEIRKTVSQRIENES